MPVISHWARRLQRRIAIGECLRLAGRWGALGAVGLGIAVLLVKMWAPHLWPGVLWSLAGLPILAAGLVLAARRRLPSEAETIAMLDARANAGGLLMMLSERPDPRWEALIPDAPRLRGALPSIVPEPCFRAVGVPAIFLAGALALPSGDAASEGSHAALSSDVSRELESGLAVLRQSESVEPATIAQLSRDIGALTEAIEGQPLTHESWVAVDSLRGRMRSVLQGADVSLIQGQDLIAALNQQLAGEGTGARGQAVPSAEAVKQALAILQENPALRELAIDWAAESAGDRAPEARELVREMLEDPARGRASLEGIETLLTDQRNTIARARTQLGETFGDSDRRPPAPLSDLSAELPVPMAGPSMPPMMEALTQSAADLGKSTSKQAASLGKMLLPIDVLTLSEPGSDAASHTPPRHAPNAARERDGGGSGTRTPPDVPTSSIAKSPTWKRTLRPRHAAVVQRYFRHESGTGR